MTITPLARTTHPIINRTKAMVHRLFLGTASPEDDWDDDELADTAAAGAARIGAVVEGSQLAVGNLATAFLSHLMHLHSTPAVSHSITQRDSGISKADVYARPYKVAAAAMAKGASREDALAAGAKRLTALVSTDIQMAKVRQSRIALQAGGRKTYRRVITSANPCELCEIASDQIYYTDDLMPIHTGCSCEVQPDDEPQSELDDAFTPPAADGEQQGEIKDLDAEDASPEDYRKMVATRQHGEVGPVLTWKHQNFTGPGDLPNPITDDAARKNAQNAARTSQRRRAATERRQARGADEPTFAPGVNPDSPHAHKPKDTGN